MQKPQTIPEYIQAAPSQAQEKLQELYDCLKQAAPEAQESIKWGSPAFSLNRILFSFAGFQHHVSLYPTPTVIQAFQKELADYTTSSSTIQFPLDKPLPRALITKIAKYRIKESVTKDARWM